MANEKKQFAVFGLGNFGTSLALALQKAGCEVIAVDRDMERVDAVKDSVSYAVRANIEDESLIRSLEVNNLDGLIISAANNMEASVMATLLAKEEGVPYILAKAQDTLQAAVLKKVGADRVIRAEQEMGQQVAHQLVFSRYADQIDMLSEYGIIEKTVPKSWVGKSLRELDVRNSFGVTVSAIIQKEKVDANPDPAKPLQKGVTLILAGDNDRLSRIK